MPSSLTAEDAREVLRTLRETVDEAQQLDRKVIKLLVAIGIVVPPALLTFGWSFAAMLASVTSFGALAAFLLWGLRLATDAGTSAVAAAIITSGLSRDEGVFDGGTAAGAEELEDGNV